MNVADAEIIKNTGSYRFEYACFVLAIFFFISLSLNDHKLYQTLGKSNNHYSGSLNSYSTNTCSTLKPKNLSNPFNEFNNFSSQQNKKTENIINCKYYDIKEIQILNNLSHKNALSLLMLSH